MHYHVIDDVFAFLKARHPLVLASMLSNSNNKDLLKEEYDRWIAKTSQNPK